jgi:hypothetical protein
MEASSAASLTVILTGQRWQIITGSLGVKYIKPTPMGIPLTIRARVEGEVGYKTRILCEVYAGEILTALGDSIFVQADIGHLANAAHEVRSDSTKQA